MPNARASRLLFQLPSNARTIVREEPAAEWTWTEFMLNEVNYNINVLGYYWQSYFWANSKKSGRGAQPKLPEKFNPFKPKKQKSEQVMTTDELDEILSRPRISYNSSNG